MTQSSTTRIEQAAAKLSRLLRWGLAPPDAPESQQPEWPYQLKADGDHDTEVLIEHLRELDDALKERGLF